MKNNYDEVRKILLAEPTSLADFRSKQKLEYAITNNRIELLLAKPIDGNFD